MPKYKLTPGLLDKEGGIAKLERDGFKRPEIMKAVNKYMDSIPAAEKGKYVKKLYDRTKPC